MPQPTQARRTAQRPAQSAAQRAPQPPPQAEPEPEQYEEEDPFADQETESYAGNSDNGDFDFDSMVLDLENVEEPVRDIWPNGTYPAIIESVEPDVSQAKGNPMLVWQLHLSDPSTGKEKNRRYYTVLVGDGAGRTKRSIKRVAPDLDLSQFRPNDAGDLLSGLECRAVLRRGRYQGEATDNVVDILAPLGDFAQ